MGTDSFFAAANPRPDSYARWSPMRQLGVCASSSANPKLTHGAEMQTRHPLEALVRHLAAKKAVCPHFNKLLENVKP
jgi:hypothetical protein